MSDKTTKEKKKLVLDIRQLESAGTFALQHIQSEVVCSCNIENAEGKATLVIKLTIESGAKEITVIKSDDGKEREISTTPAVKSNFPLIYIENKIIAKKSGARELNLKFNFDEGVIDSLGSNPGSKPDGSQVSINIS